MKLYEIWFGVDPIDKFNTRKKGIDSQRSLSTKYYKEAMREFWKQCKHAQSESEKLSINRYFVYMVELNTNKQLNKNEINGCFSYTKMSRSFIDGKIIYDLDYLRRTQK